MILLILDDLRSRTRRTRLAKNNAPKKYPKNKYIYQVFCRYHARGKSSEIAALMYHGKHVAARKIQR